MPTYYTLGGISKRPTTPDRLCGWTEVFFYNPTSLPCQATITGYFEQLDSITFDREIKVAPFDNGLFVMPDGGDMGFYPELFKDVGFWGLRFDTSTILDIVTIQINGAKDELIKKNTFKGGVSHLLAGELSTQWHFADGYWLYFTGELKEKIAKGPFPFNELEVYYFLNPNPESAKVDLILQFRNLEPQTIHLEVPAGRVSIWRNDGQIPYNQPYGVTILASLPIATTSARYIYSLEGFSDWGINLHCGMPPQVGPITE
jgi:hypothetical protein